MIWRFKKAKGLDCVEDFEEYRMFLNKKKARDGGAKTLSLGISQDMFGDLSTVSMSFAFGDNEIGQNVDVEEGEDEFEETAEVRSYRLGVSQIFTKSLIMAFTFETITDEGYLNNP